MHERLHTFSVQYLEEFLCENGSNNSTTRKSDDRRKNIVVKSIHHYV